MKKFFTFMLVAFAAVVARATDFNEPIVVTVNGVSSEQSGVITVVENNGTYDLTMKNFVLASEDGPMGVGNVALTGIVPQTVGNTVILQTAADVMISEGDDPSVFFWMGPMLGPVPVDLKGKIENGHLRCFININLAAMGQIIQVTIGRGYQMANQSFEAWHTSSGNYVEPNAWHSFESATGSLASMAGHHLEKSADAHSGEASARIYATSIFGIVANGTMTTGRMSAASMSASDTSNNAYLDTSKTDVDGNGDPFYTAMYSRPDSMAVWVKFKQGKANANHPYATVSAAITDGTYYQDPMDKEYTNVVAKAGNGQIAVTNGEWRRVSVPFVYTDNSVDPQAILITISTNADPGQGSANDEVLVDDIEFIYNAQLTSLKVKGQSVPDFNPATLSYEMQVNEEVTADDIEAEADGKGALVVKTVEAVAEGYNCNVVVYAGDMSQINDYSVFVKSTPNGIVNVKNDVQDNTCYNLQGQKVQAPTKGLYIINGKKVVKK